MPLESNLETNTFKADLHIHTNFSDGTLPPLEILQKAKTQNLSAISITDHDTIDGFLAACPLAKDLGIILGPGVELSSSYKGNNVHVLGYDFDKNNNDLLGLLQKHTLRREERNHAILEKLTAKGMPIAYEELLALTKKTQGRVHIATLMLQKRFVSSIEEAFDRYIGNDKPCFVAGNTISIEDSIEIIHSAKGKAFFAHPYFYPTTLVEEIIHVLPLNGIEVYYGAPSKKEQNRWKIFAQNNNLLCSGGSDFHGLDNARPTQKLGSHWVDEATFYAIFTHSIT